jgi:hypothetical protein
VGFARTSATGVWQVAQADGKGGLLVPPLLWQVVHPIPV